MRVVADTTTECMRQQLMTIADAEYRDIGCDRLTQPARGGFTPIQPVGNHRARAGDDDAGYGARRRQLCAAVNAHAARLRGRKLESAPKPLREIAVSSAHGGNGLAGLHDQQLHVSIGGSTPTTSAMVVTPRATCCAALTRKGRMPSPSAVSASLAKSSVGWIICRNCGEMRIIS